ncbi:hypothetical protein [Phenylobacterium hankyongense]|nr:hypothetical protein [Phenylobacterium hankyongense]
MRALALAAALLLLAGCAGVLDNCPDGLSPAPWDSTAPHTHG